MQLARETARTQTPAPCNEHRQVPQLLTLTVSSPHAAFSWLDHLLSLPLLALPHAFVRKVLLLLLLLLLWQDQGQPQ